GIGHAFRPDVKAAAEVGWNLPHAPDAFALVVALVEHVVLAEIAFGPVALAGIEEILAAEQEFAHPVAPFGLNLALGKGDVQLHQVAAGDFLLQEEARPRAAWEAGVGFRVHGCYLSAHVVTLPVARSLDSSPVAGPRQVWRALCRRPGPWWVCRR